MSSNVYTGFWTNWEDGKVKGGTLTLKTTQGLILVSFLTLFVRFSGACFWRILCFMLHQSRSTVTSRDGLFHQQQVILRNSITAPVALWDFFQSARTWKGKVDSPIRKSLSLLFITTFHIAFFATASLFSSRVTDTYTNLALIRPGTCGFPVEIENPRNVHSVLLNPDELLKLNVESILGRLAYTKSAAYVRSCYNDDTSAAIAICNVFVKPHLSGLEASAVRNATCPFGSDACITPAARFDSGHLHSGEDLGINMPDSDSLTMRRVTTCAPVYGEEKYATGWKKNLPETRENRSNTTVKFYEMGRTKDNGCEATSQDAMTPNTTFCISKYEQQTTELQSAYRVQTQTAYQNNPNASDFTPIADFDVPNSDTTLLAIYSQAYYYGEVTDPLYKAGRHINGTQFYSPSNDLSLLGCTEQYQFCNFATGNCTALSGLYNAQQAIDRGDLALNAHQQAVYTVMWKAAWTMSLQWAFQLMSDQLLLAQDWLFTSTSHASSQLLEDQWFQEAYNLHNLSLAIFQRRIHEFASPESVQIRSNLASSDQIIYPTDPNLRALCATQKVRSSDHSSISVLGMTIILVIGCIFIILDWVLIEEIFWFRSFTHHRLAKKQDWQNTGTLQLQRKMLEARGVGPWDVRDYEFPVLTTRGQMFTNGLEARSDEAGIPLGHVNGGDDYAGYWGGREQGTTSYGGGSYYAVPNKGGEVLGLVEDKKVDRV